MEHTIRIPLSAEVYEEFSDCLVESEKEPDGVIWNIIKSMCKDARIGKLNKSCSYITFDSKGNKNTQTQPLKDIVLENVGTDPQWLPDGLDKDSAMNFEYKINEKLWEYLQLYCSFDNFRRNKIIESIEKNTADDIDNKRRLLSQTASSESKKNIEQQISQLESSIDAIREDAKKNKITCIEQVVYTKAYPEIFRMITENIEQSLDKENEELYPKKKD